MGLISSAAVTYLNIVEGKLVFRVKQKTATSRTRINSEKKEVEEEVYKGISGFITRLTKTTHEKWGDFLNIYLEDSGRTYCVQCGFEGSYSLSFLKALPNADLKKKVELRPFMSEENGKKKMVLFVKQDNTTLKHYYKKDNGLPEPNVTKKRGKKDEWDFWPIVEFLELNVFDPISKQLDDGTPMDEAENPEAEKDDLPF